MKTEKRREEHGEDCCNEMLNTASAARQHLATRGELGGPCSLTRGTADASPICQIPKYAGLYNKQQPDRKAGRKAGRKSYLSLISVCIIISH